MASSAGSEASETRARARGHLIGEGDPSPIIAAGNAPAILALHGFGGTPLEIALVVDVARELGFRAHAPLLPGHGTHARDLARTGFEDWAGAARDALESLSNDEGPVIVAGLSMGAVVALHLAATVPDRVRALVLLANAAWLTWPFPAFFLNLVDRLGLPDFAVPKTEADIADPEARRTHLTYSSQPVHAAIEVLRAGERVRERIGHIDCPALIAHGKGDRVCPVANAKRIADRLASRDKTVVILPRSRHIITRDYDKDLLREHLHAFLARIRDTAQTTTQHVVTVRRA